VSSRTTKGDRHYKARRRQQLTRVGIAVSILVLGAGGYVAASGGGAETPPTTTSAGPAAPPTSGPPPTAGEVTTTTAGPVDVTTTTAEPDTPPTEPVLDPAVARTEATPVVVTRVVNGGEVKIEGGRTIKLAGVDAPALDECHGPEARDELQRRLNLGIVTMYAPSDNNAVFFTSPGSIVGPEVNADLVLVGAVDIRPGWRDEPYRTGVTAAQDDRIGMWGECPDALANAN